MNTLFMEILIIAVLITANGVLAMAEMAVVSSRKTHFRHRAQRGDKRAHEVMLLIEHPEMFLSTVQIGITTIGMLAGVFGGATLAGELAEAIASIPVVQQYAHFLSVAAVVAGISLCSLVFGELVPKRLALAYSEHLAHALAPALHILARVMKPLVIFLSATTKAILWMARLPGGSAEPPVTEDDVKVLLEQGAEDGSFLPTEKDMIHRVFRLADRTVQALMTPRPAIVWVNIDDSAEEIRRVIAHNVFSFFPVARNGNVDDIVGVARSKNILSQVMLGQELDIKNALAPPLYVPESTPALKVLELFKQSGTHLALVIDEYGSVVGLVTFDDILSSIYEDIPDADNKAYMPVVLREDGSMLIDGMLPMDEFADTLGIPRLSEEERQGYNTVGGFVMSRLGVIPTEGRYFVWQAWRIEVVDMDGRRVDKVLAKRV